MTAQPAPDVLLVSLSTTPGLRRSDAKFSEAVRAAGAGCEVVRVGFGRLGGLRRFQPAIDLVEALAARRTAAKEARRLKPRAIVFSTVTTALLQPRWMWRDHRTAIRFDCPASLNRPGWRNALQRLLERRAFAKADLLVALGEAAAGAARVADVAVLPIPVDEPHVLETGGDRGSGRTGGGADGDDRLAVAYGCGPRKRGLDLLCRAWQSAAAADARLVVAGIDGERASDFLSRRGMNVPAGVEFAGMLPAEKFSELLGKARVFVNASRWEDYGMAQLEALAAGTLLATVATPGPNEALPIARELARELVADELSPEALARSLRAAFELSDDAVATYRERAAEALAPYREPAVSEKLRVEILPRLLGERWTPAS